MGVRVAYLVAGIAVAACLGALVGCGGGGTFNEGRRAPWRAEAEHACLAGGAVQASAYVRPMEEIDGPGVCGLERPLRVSGLRGGNVGVSPPATIGCPLTAALDRWIAASVQPAARRYFGSRVVEITQIASYGCRGRNGNNYGNISEHAFGNALDMAAFRLANGQNIVVVKRLVAGDAARTGFPARGVRRCLLGILYRARTRQRPLPLQPHPRGSPGLQCQERPAFLPALAWPRTGGRSAGRSKVDRLDQADPLHRPSE